MFFAMPLRFRRRRRRPASTCRYCRLPAAAFADADAAKTLCRRCQLPTLPLMFFDASPPC